MCLVKVGLFPVFTFLPRGLIDCAKEASEVAVGEASKDCGSEQVIGVAGGFGLLVFL